MADLFRSNAAGGLSVEIGRYDPGITDEVDQKIRHLPVVLERCRSEAMRLQSAAGDDNFDIIESVDPANKRPRFYVAPSTSLGIHQELSQAVLLKAALGMGVS